MWQVETFPPLVWIICVFICPLRAWASRWRCVSNAHAFRTKMFSTHIIHSCGGYERVEFQLFVLHFLCLDCLLSFFLWNRMHIWFSLVAAYKVHMPNFLMFCLPYISEAWLPSSRIIRHRNIMSSIICHANEIKHHIPANVNESTRFSYVLTFRQEHQQKKTSVGEILWYSAEIIFIRRPIRA